MIQSKVIRQPFSFFPKSHGCSSMTFKSSSKLKKSSELIRAFKCFSRSPVIDWISASFLSTANLFHLSRKCFLFKFIFALSFIIPVLLLNLQTAVIVSLIWGFSLLTIFSFYIAKKQDKNPLKPVVEHLLIATVVVVITHFIGKLIATVFV